MRKLIVIRHAKPSIDPQQPEGKWILSDERVKEASRLAKKLIESSPCHVFASRATRAQQTAEIIASTLQSECVVKEGLHEHVRKEFYHLIALFFSAPRELVFGEETVKATQQRIVKTIKQIVRECDDDRNIIIVCHGTVISLLVKYFLPETDVHKFWKQLGTTSRIVFSLPEFRIEQTFINARDISQNLQDQEKTTAKIPVSYLAPQTLLTQPKLHVKSSTNLAAEENECGVVSLDS